MRRKRGRFAGALRGYKELNLRALRILAPGGILATYCCSQNVTTSTFLEVVGEAAADAHCEVRLIEVTSQPADHPILLSCPETHYLKGVILRGGVRVGWLRQFVLDGKIPGNAGVSPTPSLFVARKRARADATVTVAHLGTRQSLIFANNNLPTMIVTHPPGRTTSIGARQATTDGRYPRQSDPRLRGRPRSHPDIDYPEKGWRKAEPGDRHGTRRICLVFIMSTITPTVLKMPWGSYPP